MALGHRTNVTWSATAREPDLQQENFHPRVRFGVDEPGSPRDDGRPEVTAGGSREETLARAISEGQLASCREVFSFC
jgi:hypothetical protein